MKKIYKKTLIYFFKFFYSQINLAKKKYSDSFIEKEIKIQNLDVKIYRIKKCRLYTNTLDVAVIKNNYLLNGPSFQIRNNLNASIKENSIILTGTPKFYKKIKGRVFSLLTGVDSNNNYYHWFFDCLPKLFFYNKFYNLKKNDYFLVPSIKHNFQRESLKILGIKNILNAYDVKHFYIDNLITTNFTNFGDNPPLKIINYLRKVFISSNKSKTKIKKLFLNRLSSPLNQRDILNKKEVLNLLKKKKFKIINPSEKKLSNQIKYFNGSNYIIGVHGAAFTNIIFCKKNTRIIELSVKNSNNKTISNIAKKLKLRFKTFYFKSIDKNKNLKSWDGHFYISKDKLYKMIN